MTHQNRATLEELAARAKKASSIMAKATEVQKNQALEELIALFERNSEKIVKVNLEDIREAENAGLSPALIDRLSLQGRLNSLVADIRQVIRLRDPIGESVGDSYSIGEIKVRKCRTAIGVLGIIYESRPNVTLDISALSIKSGNCALLRGGSETLKTNLALVELIQEALKSARLPAEAIQIVNSKDRIEVQKLLRLHQYIDLIIPRGGAELHQYCRENSSITVITGGIGICQ